MRHEIIALHGASQYPGAQVRSHHEEALVSDLGHAALRPSHYSQLRLVADMWYYRWNAPSSTLQEEAPLNPPLLASSAHTLERTLAVSAVPSYVPR